jgi:hypothetical protein
MPFQEEGSKEVDDKDMEMKRTKEVIALMSEITTDSSEEDITRCCDKMLQIFNMSPDVKDQLITHFGVSHIMDMTEATQMHSYSLMSHSFHMSSSQQPPESPKEGSQGPSSSIAADVLRVINKIMDGSVKAQEQLIMMGILPGVIRLLSSKAMEVRTGKDKLVSNKQISYSGIALSSLFVPLYSSSSSEKSISPTVRRRRCKEIRKFMEIISF